MIPQHLEFDKTSTSAQNSNMFKRLCYLIAEGFEICSVQAVDADAAVNAKILYRLKNSDGHWRLKSEEFRITSQESEACADLFIDYLQSEGAS